MEFDVQTVDVQTIASLLVVTLAGVYLVRRAHRFYLSMRTRSGGRCGGCGSCGSRPTSLVGRGSDRDGER